MSQKRDYIPGPADQARLIEAEGGWNLAFVRELKHSPEVVWAALVDPAQLSEWAPFDSDRRLDTPGEVMMTPVGSDSPSPSRVIRAEAPNLLEYEWAGNTLMWELEDLQGRCRLRLWAKISPKFVAMGAAGWHVSLDVLESMLAGASIGRIAGQEALNCEGWRQLFTEYSAQFGLEVPSWMLTDGGSR